MTSHLAGAARSTGELCHAPPLAAAFSAVRVEHVRTDPPPGCRCHDTGDAETISRTVLARSPPSIGLERYAV
jgi:hypothetical protein